MSRSIEKTIGKIQKRRSAEAKIAEISGVCEGLRDTMPIHPDPFIRIDAHECFTPEDAIGVTPGKLTVAFLNPIPFIDHFQHLPKLVKQGCSFHVGKTPRPALVIEITKTQVKLSLQLIQLERAFTHTSAVLDLTKPPDTNEIATQQIQTVKQSVLEAVEDRIHSGAIYPWMWCEDSPLNFFYASNGAEIVHHATMLALTDLSWILLDSPTEFRPLLEELINIKVQSYDSRSSEEAKEQRSIISETSSDLITLEKLIIQEICSGNRPKEMIALRRNKLRQIRSCFKKERWATKNEKRTQSGLGHYPYQRPGILPVHHPLHRVGRHNMKIIERIIQERGGEVTIRFADYPIISRRNGNGGEK